MDYTGNPNAFARTARVSVLGDGAVGLPVEVVVTQAPNTAQISVSPAPTLSIGGAVGTSTLTVTRSGSGPVAWDASIVGAPDWVEITSGTGGTGNGDILLAYDANPNLVARNATLRVLVTTPGTQTINIAIVQAPGGDAPALSITPGSRAVTSAVGSTSFNVSNTGGGNISWTASVRPGADWATISNGATGLNAGVITVSYDANNQPVSRTATIRVTPNASGLSPIDVTVVQAQSSSGPAILLNTTQLTFGAGGGTRFIQVQTTGGDLAWTATLSSGGDWAYLPDATSGNGDGVVTVAADPNFTGDARIGSLRFSSPVSGVAAVTVELAQSEEACDVPATVTGVSASDGNFATQVRVQWDNASGATAYTVYRAASNSFDAAEPIWTGTRSSYDDLTAPAAQLVSRGCSQETEVYARFYWVVASNDCGDSTPSNVDSGYVGSDTTKQAAGGAPEDSSGSPIGLGNAVVAAGMGLSLMLSRRFLI